MSGRRRTGAGMGGGSRAPPVADKGDGGLDLVKVALEEGRVPACVAEPDPERVFVVGETVLFWIGSAVRGRGKGMDGWEGRKEGRKEGRTHHHENRSTRTKCSSPNYGCPIHSCPTRGEDSPRCVVDERERISTSVLALSPRSGSVRCGGLG